MSFFDELEGLVKGAVKTPAPVAPEPKPAGMYAAPAPAAPPVIAPRSAAESIQSVHADPYADLERYMTQEPKAAVVPAPVAAPAPDPVLLAAARTSHEPVIVKYEEPVVVSAPKGKQAFDASGALLGILMPDGKFIAVTAEPEDALNRLSEADRRPVDPAEEADTTLPQRTAGRITYLLATYEAQHPERTQARIQNDLARALFARPANIFDPDKTANAAEVKRFTQR
jgi:hypothetical protein